MKERCKTLKLYASGKIASLVHSANKVAKTLKRLKKHIGTHLGNLGVAGYTGAYTAAISTDFDFNQQLFLLLGSGIVFTFLAIYLSKD